MAVTQTDAERRQHPRHDLRLPAVIRFGGLDCTGFTANVSRGGALVRAGDDADPLLALVEPGDPVELHLAVEQDHPISLSGRVVHKREGEIGVHFDHETLRLAAKDPIAPGPSETDPTWK